MKSAVLTVWWIAWAVALGLVGEKLVRGIVHG
jgi:hypothetical protein